MLLVCRRGPCGTPPSAQRRGLNVEAAPGLGLHQSAQGDAGLLGGAPHLKVQQRLEVLAVLVGEARPDLDLALAVGPDIDYAVVELGHERYVIAADRLGAYEAELGGARHGSVARHKAPTSPLAPARAAPAPPSTALRASGQT